MHSTKMSFSMRKYAICLLNFRQREIQLRALPLSTASYHAFTLQSYFLENPMNDTLRQGREGNFQKKCAGGAGTKPIIY